MDKPIRYRCILIGIMLLIVMGNIGILSAQETRNIVLSDAQGKAGNYVKVYMEIENPKDIAGIQCTIGYDTNRLEIENKDILINESLKDFTYEKNVIKEKSYLKVSAIATKPIGQEDRTTLLSMKFRIKPNTPVGNIPITIEKVLLVDNNNKEIKGQIQNSNIIVKQTWDDEPKIEENKEIMEEVEPEVMVTQTIKNKICYIKVKNIQDSNQVTVKLSSNMIKNLEEQKVKKVQIDTEVANIMLTQNNIKALKKIQSKEVVLNISRINNPKAGIALKIIDDNGDLVNNIPEPICVQIPYHMKETQSTDMIIIKHITNEGEESILINSYFNQASNQLIFTTRSLGNFIVEYSPLEFEDMKGHKYEAAAKYLGARRIVNGIGKGMFGPDRNVTRAEFIQILANIVDIEPLAYTERNFKDVKIDAWYAAAVTWAAENNITAGTGNNRFAPNTPITQEQMVIMLLKFMRSQGYEIATKNSKVLNIDGMTLKDGANYLLGEQMEFIPSRMVTRAEIAEILTQVLKQVRY